MATVTLVGMVAGCFLIGSTIIVFLLKREFPVGGVAVSVVGLILIGMSQWTSFTFKFGEIELEVQRMRKQVIETAAAADKVAEQAEAAIVVIEKTKSQLTGLTAQIEAKKILPAATTRAIREQLSATPQVDTSELNAARNTLKRIQRPVVK